MADRGGDGCLSSGRPAENSEIPTKWDIYTPEVGYSGILLVGDI